MTAWASRWRAAFAAAALLFAPCAFADGPSNPGPDVAAQPVRAQPLPQQPAPQGRTGSIDLMNGAINLNVPAGYMFYSADEAQAYLARNSAPAPSGTILGLIARADQRIDQPGAWATVLSFQDIGYVPSNTASGLTATTFEGDVRAARQTQGRTFEGFATAPAFVDASADLSWAERAAAPGTGGKDMRFEQRKLGRTGVVSLTSIGSADQLPAMQQAAPDLLQMVSFEPGQRYADYQAASDRVSNFTIPALVTGVPPAPVQTAASTTQTAPQSGFAGLSGWFPFIAIGIVVLAAGGYLLTRRRRDDNMLPNE